MAIPAGVFGTSFETILPMTGTLVMTAAQANTNLVVGTSGLAATLTLPTVAQMVASQNREILISNLSTSGGTLTFAAATGDTIAATSSALTVTAGGVGAVLRHDGLKTWYRF